MPLKFDPPNAQKGFFPNPMSFMLEIIAFRGCITSCRKYFLAVSEKMDPRQTNIKAFYSVHMDLIDLGKVGIEVSFIEHIAESILFPYMD